jgi:hypothetical protein
MKLNINKIKYFLNWAVFLFGLTNMLTGIIRFPGIFMFIALKIGISNNQILNFIHRWSGVVAGGLILIHIIFNWRWILKISRSFKKGLK